MKTGANQIITGRPERARDFRTISLRPVGRVYGPSDVASVDYDRDLADPGVFPYTRGIHETGYRGKP
jgi:methylmalonyl-CoA mutase, N-terminal domain